MSHLEIADDEIVGHIYEASYRPEHWAHVLQRVAAVTNSRSALMMYQDHQCERATATWYYNLGADEIARFNNARTPDPTLMLVASRLPLGVASANHFLLPDEQERRTYYGAFYEDMLLPHDMYYVGGVVLFNDASRALAIGLHRGARDAPWTREELARLTALSPHFQRAVLIHREFTLLRNRVLAMQTNLDRMVLGVVLIDHLLECVYLNPAAERVIEHCNVLTVRDKRLEATNAWEQSELRDAIDKAAAFHHGQDPQDHSTAIGLCRIDRRVRYPVLVTPAPGLGPGFIPGEMSGQIAVLVSDPERQQPIVPGALHDLWGLTPTETRVAIAVANGHEMAEIADMHGTRLTTIKSHLRSIYRKLGVSNKADVVKLLLTGPFRVDY